MGPQDRVKKMDSILNTMKWMANTVLLVLGSYLCPSLFFGRISV